MRGYQYLPSYYIPTTRFGILNGPDGGSDLMCLQNPRGYPYENLANFLEFQSKFRISSVLEPISVHVWCLEIERRQISSGENRTLVIAKLPSAPPALRAGTSIFPL